MNIWVLLPIIGAILMAGSAVLIWAFATRKEIKVLEKIAQSVAILLCVTLFIGAIAWQVGVWRECRETNSVMYCLRIISK